MYRWPVSRHSELLIILFFVFTVTLTVSYFAGSCVRFSASLWPPNEGAQRDIQVSELQDRYVCNKQGLFSGSDLSGKLAHVYKPSHPTVTNPILSCGGWVLMNLAMKANLVEFMIKEKRLSFIVSIIVPLLLLWCHMLTLAMALFSWKVFTSANKTGVLLNQAQKNGQAKSH